MKPESFVPIKRKAIGIFYGNYIDLGEIERVQPTLEFPITATLDITRSIETVSLEEGVVKRLIFEYRDAGHDFIIYEFKGEYR